MISPTSFVSPRQNFISPRPLTQTILTIDNAIPVVAKMAMTEEERLKQMSFVSTFRDISNSIEKQKREFELRFDAPRGI